MSIESQSREDMRAIGFWFLMCAIIGGVIGGTIVVLVVYCI